MTNLYTQNTQGTVHHDDDYNYNNNYNNNHHQISETYNKISESYNDSMGRSIPKAVWREINAMLSTGIPANFIVAVIEYTASAPQPSWAYARAVIERNLDAGIATAEAFRASVKKKRAAPPAASKKRVQEQNYEQRAYSEELNGLSDDQLREMASIG